ncbi:hypothetical protein METBIDRAFT_38171 [Metschnikowia bicuspidata var. bicuspidata NRRL YB-4993]|uniref:Uncharacterized protein n=1 Tax=Metschnikowia bicuspidata var. bicuspidata NRRL YB-4993 TaxID=869754 RepID=A0A1A0HG14_9ASCO|nr:hypothetical protein METBIDRAFT_38171 [Metschnikowia bicuspidata var. bicuspidata NRRL YB-4993]OBA22925.1 hypothetical protein METBIDRAFT_38171 [Metschnikowia bicuspidata var. bicuspidata NRRL YB-4993]
MRLDKLTSGSKHPPTEPPTYEDVELSDSSPALTPITSSQNEGPRFGNQSPYHNLPSCSKTNGRNKPYQPPKHLQTHIDRLNGLGLNLATVSTDTRTEYFDILPSFQMFQSILKRNDFEFDEGNLGLPSVYVDTPLSSSDSPCMTQDQLTLETQRVLDSAARSLAAISVNDEENNDIDEFEGQYLFSENELEEGLQSVSRLRESSTGNPSQSENTLGRAGITTPRVPGILTHESYGNSVLDNIDMLPHAKSSPLGVQIFVTKDVPAPHSPCELETKLKEYSSGDAVHGYVIITNNLDESVDFGLFTVSLECTVKAVYASVKGHLMKPRAVLQKKLLKMYDLNASYNEGLIPSSAGIEYDFLSRDEYDGCIIGLPNDRILKPKERYKKFVMFKFPEMLLDNACPHGVVRHTMPPPSFGLDCTAFYRRASTIEINKALGYGFLNSRGSPMKLKDYSFDDVSVSYTIDAKFIDKLHAKDQRVPFSTQDVNDPQNPLQYMVSQSAQFFLRYIPDVNGQVSAYSKAFSAFGYDTFDSIGIDGVLYSGLAKRQTWQFIERMNMTIEQEIQSALDKREFKDEELKRKHLFASRVNVDFNNRIHPATTNGSPRFFSEAIIRNMEANNIVFSNESIDIYAKKKKRLLLSVCKVGQMMLCLRVPEKLLPYGSPKLIQKYNDGKRSSASFQLASPNDEPLLLHPVNSNMLVLYNRTDNSVITDIDIQLYFKTTLENTRPPIISLIDLEVVAWSYRTDYPIPLSFEHDFFYTKPHVAGAVIQHDDVEITKQNLLKLKETVNHYISFLRETKTFISQNTYSYLKGLSNMGIKKDTLKEYLQNIHSSSQFGNEDWTGEKVDFDTVLWSKSLKVPIKVLNKNNITLPPSFQSCLVGRVYSIQVYVKFKGGEDSQNVIKMLVPVLVG